MKCSAVTDGHGIPARPGARPASTRLPLLGPTLGKLDGIGPLPDDITVHLDAGYDSQKTRDELARRGLIGQIARKGIEAPLQAGQRWPAERTSAWHNSFSRLQRRSPMRSQAGPNGPSSGIEKADTAARLTAPLLVLHGPPGDLSPGLRWQALGRSSP